MSNKDTSKADNGREESPLERDPGILGEIARAAEAAEAATEADQRDDRERRRGARRPRSIVLGCILAVLGVLLGAGIALLVSRSGGEEPDRTRTSAPPAVVDGRSRLVFATTPERPPETPDIIPVTTDHVYCFYELAGAAPDAPLAARWWHDGAPLGSLPLRDHQPDPDAEYATGRFAIAPPERPAGEETSQTPAGNFPPGLYEVEVAVRDRPDIAVRESFMALPGAAKILSGGGEPEGPPVVRELHFATELDDEGQPVDPRSTFPPTVDRIYVAFRYAGVPPGAALTVRWWGPSGESEIASREIAVTSSEGWANAWLDAEGGDLPAVDYRVTVHLGSETDPIASAGFSVTEDAPN